MPGRRARCHLVGRPGWIAPPRHGGIDTKLTRFGCAEREIRYTEIRIRVFYKMRITTLPTGVERRRDSWKHARSGPPVVPNPASHSPWDIPLGTMFKLTWWTIRRQQYFFFEQRAGSERGYVVMRTSFCPTHVRGAEKKRLGWPRKEIGIKAKYKTSRLKHLVPTSTPVSFPHVHQ